MAQMPRCSPLALSTGSVISFSPRSAPVNPPNDRYCAQCTYLVGRRTYSDLAESWTCHAPENVTTTSRDLVTGNTVYHLRFTTCYDARGAASEDTGGCGAAGKWFKEYVTPEFRPRVVAGKEKTAQELLKEIE